MSGAYGHDGDSNPGRVRHEIAFDEAWQEMKRLDHRPVRVRDSSEGLDSLECWDCSFRWSRFDQETGPSIAITTRCG